MTEFERIFTIHPAFDRRNPDPEKNYGVHGCELRMVLKGPKGAVQFVLLTNWQLPHVTEDVLKKSVDKPMKEIDLKVRFLPLPADLGYHSMAPMWEDEKPSHEACPYLDGKPCYYDGSGLNAERVYEILLIEGSEGVWRYLENYYYDTFEDDIDE